MLALPLEDNPEKRFTSITAGLNNITATTTVMTVATITHRMWYIVRNSDGDGDGNTVQNLSTCVIINDAEMNMNPLFFTTILINDGADSVAISVTDQGLIATSFTIVDLLTTELLEH